MGISTYLRVEGKETQAGAAALLGVWERLSLHRGAGMPRASV